MRTAVKIVVIAALILVALILPAAAAQECIVPPPEYFVTDGPMNGQPVHDGIQLGYRWSITADQRIAGFSGSNFLGITEYELKQSHTEQEKIAFGQKFYCYSIPDYPYEPVIGIVSEDPTGVSTNPEVRDYLTVQEMRADGQ